MKRAEYPLNQPFEHRGHEIVAVRAKVFSCVGCVHEHREMKFCQRIACRKSERSDSVHTQFITLDQFYVRRLKGEL